MFRTLQLRLIWGVCLLVFIFALWNFRFYDGFRPGVNLKDTEQTQSADRQRPGAIRSGTEREVSRKMPATLPLNAARGNVRNVIVPGTSSEIPPAESDPYVGQDLQVLEVEYFPATNFPQAADEFNVPEPLLKAVAYAESHGQHGTGLPRPNGGRGVMGLKEMRGISQVAAAASLIKVPPQQVVIDPAFNIRAGAALLRYYYDQSKEVTDTERWKEALERYSGQETNASDYADRIDALMEEGFSRTLDNGELLEWQGDPALLLDL